MTTKAESKWWAAPGQPPDNHSYVIDGEGVQLCHICSEVEQAPGPWHLTYRAAKHLVHGVRTHLDATTKEWGE
jgi:hypothetical protein